MLSCCYANASERSVRIKCELNEAFWVSPLEGIQGRLRHRGHQVLCGSDKTQTDISSHTRSKSD